MCSEVQSKKGEHQLGHFTPFSQKSFNDLKIYIKIELCPFMVLFIKNLFKNIY